MACFIYSMFYLILLKWRKLKQAIKPLLYTGLKAIICNFERTFANKIWKI